MIIAATTDRGSHRLRLHLSRDPASRIHHQAGIGKAPSRPSSEESDHNLHASRSPDPLRTPLASSERTHLAPLCQDATSSARPRLLRPGEPFQWAPIAHGPTMTKWIGKASLTMQPPRRMVLSCGFHVGRASLCSLFYEVIGGIDEDFDPGRRQAHVRRARLLILTRHGFVEKEWRAIEVKPGNAVKIPQLAGAQRLRVPADRSGSVGHDQHYRKGWARRRVTHSHSLCHRFRRPPVRTWPASG
jgi:hypothetical protein